MNLEKQNKRHISTTHTYENDVKYKKQPKGGIKDIQDAIIARLEWAESLHETVIDKKTYDMLLGILITSFFVFSVQGRISGIADMKVMQLLIAICIISILIYNIHLFILYVDEKFE